MVWFQFLGPKYGWSVRLFLRLRIGSTYTNDSMIQILLHYFKLVIRVSRCMLKHSLLNSIFFWYWKCLMFTSLNIHQLATINEGNFGTFLYQSKKKHKSPIIIARFIAIRIVSQITQPKWVISLIIFVCS